MVGGPPLHSAKIKRGEGAGAPKNDVRRAASTLSHILNPSRSRGALEQRESPPLPSTLIHRRRRHRSRLRRHVHDASALLVAAFERISINEPVMAGPSSSAGTEGPQSRSSLSFLCVSVVDLGLCCTQIKERREILLDPYTV